MVMNFLKAWWWRSYGESNPPVAVPETILPGWEDTTVSFGRSVGLPDILSEFLQASSAEVILLDDRRRGRE
jgi:hypothetical protein